MLGLGFRMEASYTVRHIYNALRLQGSYELFVELGPENKTARDLLEKPSNVSKRNRFRCLGILRNVGLVKKRTYRSPYELTALGKIVHRQIGELEKIVQGAPREELSDLMKRYSLTSDDVLKLLKNE